MAFSEIARRGLVMLGCGKMGSAMLEGWLNRDLPPSSVFVIDPHPSDWLTAQGVSVNARPARQPRRRPAGREAADDGRGAAEVARFGGGGTLFLSVAAGTPIATFEAALGAGTRIVRAMPNTPAAIGQGITAIVGNAAAGRRTSPWPRRFCPPWGRSCGWRPRTRSTR
jgi:pyrroline-5-carboxylate reductase